MKYYGYFANNYAARFFQTYEDSRGENFGVKVEFNTLEDLINCELSFEVGHRFKKENASLDDLKKIWDGPDCQPYLYYIEDENGKKLYDNGAIECEELALDGSEGFGDWWMWYANSYIDIWNEEDYYAFPDNDPTKDKEDECYTEDSFDIYYWIEDFNGTIVKQFLNVNWN